MRNRAIALAMTGASGAPYGLRLLQMLVEAGRLVYFMISTPGRVVLEMEAGLKLPTQPREMAQRLSELYQFAPERIRVFGKEQWTAPVASGSSAPEAMVICPCTSGTLASLAAGHSRNLIERAADVALKEQRKLILVLRETPLSIIQLENMLRLARAGAVILPATPGFYHQPKRIDDLVDFVVARILDHLDVPHDLMRPWGE